MKNKFSFSFSIVVFLNCLAAASLLLSQLACYVSPSMVWEIAFFGLAFPYLVFLNLIFFLYWLLRKKWTILISLIPLLLGYRQIAQTVQVGFFHKQIPASEKNIRVMSFNVRLFDLYDWSHNLETRANIFSFLKSEKPDILCIQEFFSSPSRHLNNTDSLSYILSESSSGKFFSHHAELTEMLHEDDFFGAATFTSFPIVGKGKIIFDVKSHNICIWTDVLIESDTVRIFNIHLQSIRFADEDYRFIENITGEKEEAEIKGTLKILKRMKRAYLKRAVQTEKVAEMVSASPYPVILCGDFNDPPTSYAYNKISKNLTDAFVESGSGFAKTYAGRFPSFRIDYILHDKNFRASDYRTIHEELSDHYPVSCVLMKEKK